MARTASITRASKAALTRTGSRSSRPISRIFRSSSSRTVHLTQQLTESIARTHHAHLQGRNPNPRQLRHFVVAKLFDILQDERFALIRPQLLQRAVDLFAPGALLGG